MVTFKETTVERWAAWDVEHA